MQIKISYYKCPFNEDDKPVHYFNSSDKLKSHYRPYQLNNHSGIIWEYANYGVANLSQQIYYIYDLRNNI